MKYERRTLIERLLGIDLPAAPNPVVRQRTQRLGAVRPNRSPQQKARDRRRAKAAKQARKLNR